MTPIAAGQPSVRAVPRRVRLGPADVALYLWRAKWLMAVVFLPLFACGILAAMALPVRHEAQVHLVAAPVDAAGRSLTVQSELDLLRSAPVVARAVSEVGPLRLYPALAQGCGDPDCEPHMVRAAQRALKLPQAQASGILRISFIHTDPEVAAAFLKALFDAYGALRPGLVQPPLPAGLGASYARLEGELAEAEAALRDFRGQTDAALPEDDETLRHLSAEVRAAILRNSARLTEVQGQLSVHQRQIRSIAPEQDLFIEDAAGQRLQELHLERERWRARVSPDHPALIDLDRQIERAEAARESSSWPEGLRRRGANPLYQELQGAILRLEAEAAALVRQQTELAEQLAVIEARRNGNEAVPQELAALVRQRDVAARALAALADRDADLRVRAQLEAASGAPLSRLEPVAVMRKGETLRIAVALGSVLAALFAALAAGWGYARSRRGFATPSALERTLGLPVLASAPARPVRTRPDA
ncbi:hypothetical protein [Hyphomonas sp.]|uniref:hypothetical protein n=1 Tax=Hyphomonas sp. TaxID=87 RepID=UPI00391D4549